MEKRESFQRAEGEPLAELGKKHEEVVEMWLSLVQEEKRHIAIGGNVDLSILHKKQYQVLQELIKIENQLFPNSSKNSERE